MRLSRADKSILSQWWFTVDRLLLAATLALMATGLVFSLAASPPMAVKHGLEPFHYFRLHALWFAIALFLLIATSMLTMKQIRRFSLILFAVAIALMVLALGYGEEINGAHRWIRIGNWSLQPSELAKPAFVVLAAWFFAEDANRPDMPGKPLAFMLYALFAGLLLLQPDLGQALLITAVWGALYFLAGAPLAGVGILGILASFGLIGAYFVFPHVRARVDQYLFPASTDTYQVDKAIQSFSEGGWFGRGPGEGMVKRSLPDSHTDFLFAVVGEEFGAIVCLVVLALFTFIVLRVLSRATKAQNRFSCFGASALIALVGLQAAINMGVNTGLLPAKGMTLPFLSYGGSSLLGLSLTMGIVLGLTRRPALRAQNDVLTGMLRHKNAMETRRISRESLI